MKPGVRRVVMAAALFATLSAAIFAPSESGEVIAPAQPSRIEATGENRIQPANTESGSRVLDIHPRGIDEEPDGAFAPNTWVQPKVVHASKEAAAEPQPAPPQAPPLPFRVLGRYVEHGTVAIFLQHNDRNLVVRVGDTIDGNYKIESIASGAMTLVYLPLNQKQTLAVGEMN